MHTSATSLGSASQHVVGQETWDLASGKLETSTKHEEVRIG